MVITATGGHVGTAAANPDIALVSALGACGTLPTSIVINELTSATAAYALSGFAPAGTTAAKFQGKSPGLNQAFLTLTNLIDPSTGLFAINARVTNPTVVEQRLATVADAMVGCNAKGAAVCAELFSCARANAVYVSTGQPCTGGTGPVTADSLNAALAIVQNAGLVSMAGIYDVVTASGKPFIPALSAAPAEWTLPLVFSVRNVGPLAVDAGGHVWMLAPDPNPASPPPAIPNLAVTEIDADGTFISPHKSGHDWSAGGVSSIQSNDITNLAIDSFGNVWVSGSGTIVAELTSTGTGVTGAPWSTGSAIGDTSAITIDSNGNAWITSGANAPVFELSQSGSNKSTASGYTASNCPCDGMAADASGNVWTVSNSGSGQFLAQINSSGVQGPVQVPPDTGGGLAHLTTIATDASGHLWMTDQHYHSVWEFTPSGSGGSFSAANGFANQAGPGTIPKAIAIDGAGHKWVANDPPTSGNFPSITELSADGTVNLSPSNGFGFQVNSAVAFAYGLAIDGSGNVWVTDGGSTVTEYVGAAAPTKNPIVSAVSSGDFSP